jgi:hypothetical protein
MSSSLGSCSTEDVEKVWLVTWQLAGEGPVFDRLHDEKYRRDLLVDVSARFGARGIALSQASVLCPDADNVRSDGSLAAEYFSLLEQDGADLPARLSQILAGAGIADADWKSRLETLLPEIDASAVLSHARRLGATWFVDAHCTHDRIGDSSDG